MKNSVKNIGRLLSRNILSTSAVLALMGVAAFAAAPTGGYAPGATLDPDCSPGDTDCSVVFTQDPNKFVDGVTSTDAVFTGGNVGIGTDSPDESLTLVGGGKIGFEYNAGDTRTFHTIESTGGTMKFVQGATNSATVPGYAFFDPNGETDFAIMGNGNVGIGTTSPSAKLHIESDETANIKLWSSGVDEDAYLQLGTLASGENFEFRLDESDERKLKIGPDSSNPEMTIQQNGYVGINTTNPLARLTIDASASDTTLFLKDGSQDIAFLEDQALQIGTINATGTGWTEQMRINGSNGNVGIGTTSPSAKLEVAGTVKFPDLPGCDVGDVVKFGAGGALYCD